MASDLVRIEVQYTIRGKTTKNVIYCRGQSTVSTLKSYLREFYGLEGMITLRGQYAQPKKTIAKLQLRKNEALELIHVIKTQARRTISCTVRISDEEHQILVPVSCTVESLLFHVESEKKILKEHQCFKCATRKYAIIEHGKKLE